MVSSRCHGTDTIVSCGKTTFDGGCKETLAVSGVVDALEENKGGWVRRSGGGQAVAEGLDGDVGVANDFAILQLLRGSVIGGVRIGECAWIYTGHLDGDIKSGVGLEVLARFGVGEDTRHHVCSRWDIAHDYLRVVLEGYHVESGFLSLTYQCRCMNQSLPGVRS